MYSSWSVALSVLFFLGNVLLSDETIRDVSTTILYKWRAPEFDYANDKAKSDAIKRAQFVPNNVLILDADYYPVANRYFVTTPQFRNGTPATLSEIDRGKGGVLKPFPSWPNNKNSCQGPFSVFRTYIDKCGLLWAPDTGRSEIMTVGKATCSPKLLVYDLNNRDKEILNYEFPKGVVTDRSLLINIITESYQKDCSDSFAYLADVMDHGLIVFDYARKSSWRIENKYFYIYPPVATITTNGVTFDSTDGIFGLALGPSTERNRKLYFHSFASVHESWVPVSVLKNQTLASDASVARSSFVLSPGQRAGQSTVQVMTDDGILIYPLIPTNSLACWNSRTPFTIENQYVLGTDNENFQFISGMKLMGNRLLIMSSRFQNFNVGMLNGTDFKYRVVVIEDVKCLLQNTPCSTGSSGEGPYGGGSHTSSTSQGGFLHSNGGSQHSSNSNGGQPCYGSSCEKPQTSHASAQHTGTNPGVIFKPHHRPHTYGKQVNDNFLLNRLGDWDEETPTTTTTNRLVHHVKTEPSEQNLNEKFSSRRRKFYGK